MLHIIYNEEKRGISMDYIIHNTPNWLFEAAACLSEQYLKYDC